MRADEMTASLSFSNGVRKIMNHFVVKYFYLVRFGRVRKFAVGILFRLNTSSIAHDHAMIAMGGGVDRLARLETLGRRRDDAQGGARGELDLIVDRIAEINGPADCAREQIVATAGQLPRCRLIADQ
jgi:hypothetical protein